MKKLNQLIPRRISRRNAFYAAILIAIISIVFYSCRKYDPGESFSNESLTGISEKAKINPLELAQWFKNSPVPVKNGKWNQAKQAVINGKHVIRVPVSDDAVYVFTKDNENKPMNVYAYKWHNEKPKEKKFTGEVIWFSFQDYKLRTQRMNNGIPGATKIFKAKKDLTPIVKNKDKYAVAIAKKVKQIQSGQMTIADDGCDIEIPGYSTCYAVAQEIIDLYASIFCFLESGIWINSTCDEQFWNTDLNDALNWMGDPYGNEGTIDRNWAFTLLEDVGVGGGGGGWAPQWLEYGWSAVYLAEVMEIDLSDAEWVNSSYETNRLTEDIIAYVGDMTDDPNKFDIARDHLDLMKADQDYMDYSYEYHSNFYQFYDPYVWWENEGWLADEQRFDAALTNGYIDALGISDRINSADYLEPEDTNNTAWTGSTGYIPNPIVLSNNDEVVVEFGAWTKDKVSSNQLVSTRLITALTDALNTANQIVRITSIRIYSTTNGGHDEDSNHYRGTAIDINYINGQRVFDIGNASPVTTLQTALDGVTNRRENFGPAFKHKWGSTWTVSGHKDHIHFSVNGN